MPGSTLVRAATKQAVVDLLAADPQLAGTVQVAYGEPEGERSETIYVGASRGTLSIAGMKAGRKTRHDNFVVDLWVEANLPGQETALVADQRAEALLAQAEDLLALTPDLGVGVAGLSFGHVGEVEGPDPIQLEEGWGSLIRAELAFLARLT